MQSTRVFITRNTAICSMGIGSESLAHGLEQMPQAVDIKDFEFHQFDTSVSVYAIRDYDAVAVLGKVGLRNKDNATKLILGTIETGFKDILESLDEKQRPGICAGTAFGSVQSIGDFLSDSIVNGVNSVNPQLFANTVINSPIGNANIRYSARNLSATISTGFNAGLDALIYSSDIIKRGYQCRIVAGGIEEISYYALLGLQRSGLLSESGLMRPFALQSDGVVMGEGCAMFLLESEEAMRARGAVPVAEICGTASLFDPGVAQNGIPDNSCGREVITRALSEAGVGVQQIDFIASSANGNTRSDSFEVSAIRTIFGNNTPITAYKAKFGECYGASGALCTACALSDMKNDRISGTGFEPYETINGIPLVFSTIQKQSTFALVTAFSCEGNCSALVLKICK